MDPQQAQAQFQTRRQFFAKGAQGLGVAALASLLGKDLAANDLGRETMLPHFAPRAKRGIYLFMNGGPTHTDLWDYKSRLQDLHGTPTPESFFRGKRFSTMTGKPMPKRAREK